MTSKDEAKSLKWKRKRDKRLPSKLIKWASKWQQRQDSFLHNKSINWASKSARRSVKIARKFGKINHKEGEGMKLDNQAKIEQSGV